MSAQRPLRPAAVGAVALGGAIGALLRWAVTSAVPHDATGFPWATFAVNVSGSLLLAVLPALPVVRRHGLLAPLLGAGLCGGYTTLSAYAGDARVLLAAGQTGLAATYVVGTLAACLLAVALADRLVTAPARRRFEARGGVR